MLMYRIDHCARNDCAMTHGYFISAVKLGTKRRLNAAASPAGSWSNFLKIQAVKFKFWIKLVWCPKALGTGVYLAGERCGVQLC